MVRAFGGLPFTPMRTAIREAVETVALAVLLTLLFQAAIQLFEVQGPSMDPRLATADRLLVNKALYMEIDAERVVRFLPGVSVEPGEVWHPFSEPKQGDIVVFRFPLDPKQTFVKRVIGVPGDTVEIRRGRVFVNDNPLDESYVVHDSRETLPPVEVGADEYYVMGDNRLQSNDSRNWGTVHVDNIVGRAWIGYWPLDRFSALMNRLTVLP